MPYILWGDRLCTKVTAKPSLGLCWQAEKSMRPLWLRLLVLWLIPLAGPALARPAGSRPRWSPGVVRALAQALGRGNGTQAPATTVAAAALPCVPTRADKRLRKVLLTNKTVACNDGSPAGYVRPIGEDP